MHAPDVLGVQAWVHKVHATTDLIDQLQALTPPAEPCTHVATGQPLRGVNDYVSDYDLTMRYLMCCHSDTDPCPLHGQTNPHLLLFAQNTFEGCFRVEVKPPQGPCEPGAEWDPDGDGNLWFTTVPAAYHDNARSLLTWYAEATPQVWREWVIDDPERPWIGHWGNRDAQQNVPLPPIDQLDLLPDILK